MSAETLRKKVTCGFAPMLVGVGLVGLVGMTGCGTMGTATSFQSQIVPAPGGSLHAALSPRDEPIPTVVLSATSTSFPLGSPSPMTVQVSCDAACGNVDFKIDGGEWATVPLSSSGSFTTSGIPSISVGGHTIQAFFLGGGGFGAAASNVVNFTITGNGAVSPTVTASMASASYAVSLPTTASVQVSCNTACGNVDFRIDGNEWAIVPLGASGSFLTSALPILGVGSHSLQVFYLGSANFAAAASNSINFTVVSDGSTATTAVATMSSTTISTNQPPITSVQVGCNSACGLVDFRIDGNEWGTVPLNASGSFTTGGIPSLSLGTHTLQIFYLGNASFSPAASNTITFQVVDVPTVVLTMTPTSFPLASPSPATVQVGCNSACGQVDFRIDGNEWATVPLNSSGSFTTSGIPSLSLGAHTLQALYLGSGNIAPSASNVINFTITSGGSTTPTVVLTMSPTSFPLNQASPATAQVSCDSACGQVDFRVDGNEWATVPLNSGGSFTTNGIPNLSTGPHTLQAFYLGNASFSAASSNVVNFTITP